MFRLFIEHREAFKKYLLVFFLGIVSIGMVISLAPITPTTDFGVESNVLAEIHGTPITSTELQRQVQARLRNSPLANDPQMMARMASILLEDMVLRRALRDEAAKMGLSVSDAELQKHLETTMPFLFPGGQFIGHDSYSNVISQQTGLSVAQFEAQMRESMLQEKMRALMTDSVRVTPAEVKEEFLRRNTRARIEYVLFDPAQYLNAVTVTPEALEAFFNKDTSKYKLPEQRRVRYALITADRVMAELKLDDAAIKKYYSDHLADFQVPERVRASHILFKTEGKTPEEVAATEKKAREVLAKIRAGADFAEMARTNSEDTTASNGGELGWIVRLQTVKEFEDAAFNLKPGSVSDLIRTSYGFHIVKVWEKQTAHLQSFDEVKDQVRDQLAKQQLADAQTALAARLEREFQKKPEDFAAIARANQLEPKETPLFRYNQPVPDLGTSEGFQNLAFQLRQNAVGSVSVPKGTAVIQVIEIVPEHAPRLENVRAAVEQDYRAAQSVVLAAQKAQEFAAKAKGADFAKTARALGLTPKESKDFTEQEYVEGVGSGSSLAAAFSLPVGQSSDPVSVGNNQVVFRVVARTPADEAGLLAQQDRIAEELLERKRSLVWELYQQNLKDRLKATGELRMNEAAMKRFLAAYQRT
jgi:peptidyl-prolyl cis-trans isomerase D